MASDTQYWAFEAEDGDGDGEPLHGLTFALDHQHHQLSPQDGMSIDNSPETDSDSDDSEPPPPPSQYIAHVSQQAASSDGELSMGAPEVGVPGDRAAHFGAAEQIGTNEGWLGQMLIHGTSVSSNAAPRAGDRQVDDSAATALSASQNVISGIFGPQADNVNSSDAATRPPVSPESVVDKDQGPPEALDLATSTKSKAIGLRAFTAAVGGNDAPDRPVPIGRPTDEAKDSLLDDPLLTGNALRAQDMGSGHDAAAGIESSSHQRYPNHLRGAWDADEAQGASQDRVANETERLDLQDDHGSSGQRSHAAREGEFIDAEVCEEGAPVEQRGEVDGGSVAEDGDLGGSRTANTGDVHEHQPVTDGESRDWEDSPIDAQKSFALNRCWRSCCCKCPSAPDDSDSSADEDDHAERGCMERSLFTCWASYARRGPGICPCTCLTIWFVVIAIITGIGMALFPLVVETNFDSFAKTDTEVSARRDVFVAALKEREDTGRRLLEARVQQLVPRDQWSPRVEARRLEFSMVLYMVYDLFVAYELKQDAKHQDIFHWENLEAIRDFERRLRDLETWKQLCAEAEDADKVFCESGMSFVSYAMPTAKLANRSIVPEAVKFDGRGQGRLPIESAFQWVEDHSMTGILFPKGFNASQSAGTTTLRSVFRFRLPCCTPDDPMPVQRKVLQQAKARWKGFIEDIVLPILSSPEPEPDSDDDYAESYPWPLRVYYAGDSVTGIEVMQALWGDTQLATGSFGFVLVYLVIHTRSVLLSAVGLLIIGLSVPFSYVVFAILAGTTTMSIASFLSLFLVVGLGSDVIFVYTDFWRDSSRVKHREIDRLIWTYQHAGKASLATTFTTALSFFANLVSVLKPLREFGMFMGLCVVFVWLIISGIYVPLLLLDDRYLAGCRLRFPWEPVVLNSFQMSAIGHVDATPSSRSRSFSRFSDKLYRWRKVVVVATIFTVFISLIGTAVTATTETGLPSIFPEHHNQNRGKQVLARFAPQDEVLPLLMPAPWTTNEANRRACWERSDAPECAVCKESLFDSNTIPDSHCPLFWCEADSLSDPAPASQCKCFRKHSQRPCTNGSVIRAKHRLIGVNGLTEDMLRGSVGDRFIVDAEGQTLPGMSFVGSRQTSMLRFDLPPVVVQEWESGAAKLKPASQYEANLRRDGVGPCSWEEVCYCGSRPCVLPHPWLPMGSLDLGTASRRLQSNSQQWTVAPMNRADVSVIFGIWVAPPRPLLGEPDLSEAWGFLDTFDMSEPWAQRNMYTFCRDMPEEMRVTETRCWWQGFRDQLVRSRERFPVLPYEFHQKARTYLKYGLVGENPPVSAEDQIWIRGGELKATHVSFKIDVSKRAPAEAAMKQEEMWTAHVDKFNLAASQYVSGAWHTSQLWVTAEAQRQLMSSTALTLGIVILLAFVGMVVFTWDLVLSLFVVIATVGVVCELAFFITGIMAWSVGPIEVIALIVFIGYAVTYSLHIAHKYGSPEADRELAQSGLVLGAAAATRYKRTSFALKSIGGAALGSAVTTAGCAVFLLFCTMTIFQKLGGVVLAVTVMSIAMALGPLPGLLFMLGPLSPGTRCCFGFGARQTRSFDMEGALDHASKNLAKAGLPGASAAAPRSPKAQTVGAKIAPKTNGGVHGGP